jgi:preprotein translocase subunit SecF
MKILQRKTNIDFMGKRKIALIFSAVLLIVSLVALPTRGLNFGLDFTGGTLIEVTFPTAPDISQVRDNLAAGGMDAMVQTFGAANDIVVRIPPGDEEESNAEISTRVLEALSIGVEGEIDVRRVEFVGPQVGEELTEQGILAVIYALIGIFIYVMMRFQWRFSVGAVAALVHDVLITMGALSIFQIEFDLTVVAALLAVVGYSLNDTIVLFDRIRENFPRLGSKHTSTEVVNISVNQTLSRTLMTSLTTLLVLIALFYFGGEIIHGFAYTLIMGVLIGTYSSIYVASTSLLALGVSKYDLMVVEKEGADAVEKARLNQP